MVKLKASYEGWGEGLVLYNGEEKEELWTSCEQLWIGIICYKGEACTYIEQTVNADRLQYIHICMCLYIIKLPF